MAKKQNFMHGAMILVVAGLITRGLGTVYRIFLSRMIGAEAIGLYQMAFPSLILLITIVTAGLPIAVSKMVAESEALRDTKQTQRILRISLSIVTSISLAISILFYFLIPFISQYILTDERVSHTLVMIVPIIPIISISSVLRGYFQGKQNMIPSATSTIIETIFRMGVGITLSLSFLSMGVQYASAGAMLGMVAGELAGNFILLLHYFTQKREKNRPFTQRFLLNQHDQLYAKMFRIAIPVTASQLIGSLAYFIEPGVVSHSLAFAGISTKMATIQYGQLTGMALLVITFPTVITYSLSVSLIPAISEAAAQKNQTLVYKRLHQALKMAYLIGLPASILMFIMADPVSQLLFNSYQVGHFIKIISPFSIFLYIQRPLASTLQGLDYAKESMKNSIIGASAKTIAIIVFASRSSLGIDGVAMAINLGMALITVLHFRSIIQLIGYSIEIKPLVSISLAAILMGYASYYIFIHSLQQIDIIPRLLIAIFLGSIIYLYLLLLLKVIRKQDLERVPWIGSFLHHILP
ncbi:stage V sporulation protein B [Tepidibacillus marianensis]|uniref:stage V sporulation protein B n=1 Tax=Tepidibacillus marianensis TaxID=3131995 RepID=UPI0030CD0B2C